MTVCPPSPTGVTSHLFSHSSVCSDTRLWAAGVPWMSQCQCAELGDVHLRTLTSGFISTPVDVNRKPECTSTCPFPPRHRRGRWSSPCRVVAPTLVGRKLAPVTLNVSTYLVCPSACDWLSSRCYPLHEDAIPTASAQAACPQQLSSPLSHQASCPQPLGLLTLLGPHLMAVGQHCEGGDRVEESI